MRKALIIALVVVVVVTGIPIPVGAMTAGCHSCATAMVAGGGCAMGILVMFSFVVAVMIAFIRPRRFIVELLLVYARLDRPPRLV